MIRFISLNIQGFCSIDRVHIQLDVPGTTIIRGANANGKSSLFSALVWCLYGKNLKGVSDVNTWLEVRPDNYRGTLVSTYFQRGEHTYQVIRCLNFVDVLEDGAKGNSRLILIRDAELVDIKGKANIQEEINKSIGMSYQLFMNSIMFGQGIKRLIQESNQDKKKLFEEIFDLEYLNIAKGIATDDRKDILADLNQIENESKILKAQLQENRETYFQLREEEKNFNSRIKEERKQLKKKLEGLTEDLEFKKSKLDKANDPTSSIKQANELALKYKEKLQKAKSLSNKPLDELVDGLIEDLTHKKYDQALSLLKRMRKAFNNIIKYQDLHTEQLEHISELKSQQITYNRIQREYEYLSNQVDKVDQELNRLKAEKRKVLSPKYKAKIKEVRKRLRKVDEDFHNKELDLQDYDWVITDPLGNNGIKAYLFDSSLSFLNAELEKYSEILGFRISFQMDLNGTRKEFTTCIQIDEHYADYEELSGGQKQLVNVAMAFAMNQSLTASKGINIAFLDEVFESLSSENVEIVCSLIHKVFGNKTLFLISHIESLPLSHSHIIQVQRVNGISQYIL